MGFIDFKNIIDSITQFCDSSLLDKISLHLHKNADMEITKAIISYASLTGVTRFDVSCLENAGGCSVTMEKSKLNNNLHYDDYKLIL